jgi:hypothetical protein
MATTSTNTVASPCLFDHTLVDALADGWTLNEVHAFEEGDLPRRL